MSYSACEEVWDNMAGRPHTHPASYLRINIPRSPHPLRMYLSNYRIVFCWRGMSSESMGSNDSQWTICLISKSSCILTSTSVAPARSGEVDWHSENAMYPAHVFLVLFLTTRVVCGRSVKRPLAIDHKPDLQASAYSDRYSWETRHTSGRLICEGLEKNIPRKCYRSFMKWSCGRDSLGHDVKIMKRQESWKIND